MKPAKPSARVLLGAAALLAACLAPGAAHAGAWQPAEFPGPGGKPARGFATDAVGGAVARLVIGCDGTASDAWRGLAVLRKGAAEGAAEPAADEVEVVVSFFGRTPVTARWRRADVAGDVVLWPLASESLRRNLLREDTTRGQASVTIEISAPDTAAARLVFGVDGLAERSAEIAELCGGFGADSSYRRRERGW